MYSLNKKCALIMKQFILPPSFRAHQPALIATVGGGHNI